jgi:hypothetical protein
VKYREIKLGSEYDEQDSVQRFSNEGWLLYGSPYGAGNRSFQAMIKLEDNEKIEDVAFIPKTNRLNTVS